MKFHFTIIHFFGRFLDALGTSRPIFSVTGGNGSMQKNFFFNNQFCCRGWGSCYYSVFTAL